MKKKELTLATLKESFNEILIPNRSVAIWNLKRELKKREYPRQLISELDASGFIIQWLYSN
jgi:hypothetical protein